MFNRNNVKVSYSCTENMKSIINSHNKKVTTQNTVKTPPCKCRFKEEFPLEGQCTVENIIYKRVACTSVNFGLHTTGFAGVTFHVLFCYIHVITSRKISIKINVVIDECDS